MCKKGKLVNVIVTSTFVGQWPTSISGLWLDKDVYNQHFNFFIFCSIHFYIKKNIFHRIIKLKTFFFIR